MKVFSKISSKTSALILLVSFLGIYVINIGCSIGNITQNFEWFSSAEGKHDHSSHNHGDGHHHDHGTDSDKQSQEEDDGCCDDEASFLFASVQSVPVQQTDYNFTPPQSDFLFAVIDGVSNTSFKRTYFIDNRPPPDILPRFPDTRIFIQSFQI
jgi:hypothetical protein